MDSSIIPLLAALGAASITASISFVSLVNSKDQKTTEFRQSWINSLRLEISKFESNARYISGAIQYAKSFDPLCFSRDTKAYDSYAEHRSNITEAYHSICLHFKPNDKEFLKLRRSLDSTLLLLSKPATLDDKHVKQELDLITEIARSILKTEWERVKKGELTYRVTRFIALVILGVVFLIFGRFVFVELLPVSAKASAKTSKMDAPQSFPYVKIDFS